MVVLIGVCCVSVLDRVFGSVRCDMGGVLGVVLCQLVLCVVLGSVGRLKDAWVGWCGMCRVGKC